MCWEKSKVVVVVLLKSVTKRTFKLKYHIDLKFEKINIIKVLKTFYKHYATFHDTDRLITSFINLTNKTFY